MAAFSGKILFCIPLPAGRMRTDRVRRKFDPARRLTRPLILATPKGAAVKRHLHLIELPDIEIRVNHPLEREPICDSLNYTGGGRRDPGQD